MRKHPTLYWGPVRAGQQLEPGHAPQTPLGTGDQALLAEAIRFFNFEHPVIVRAGWEPLRFRAAELTETRANIHDALFEYLLIATHDENLSALVPSTKLQAMTGSTKAAPAGKAKSSKAASAPRSRVSFNHATRARLLLRAMLVPDWRRPGRDPTDLRSLKWDQIAPAINQLRQSTRRSVIEQKLQASFGPSLLNPAGGDWGLALADRSLTESGLTEKLYFQVGAVVTDIGPRYLGWPSQPVVGPSGVPFTLHTDVKSAADAVVLAALPFIGPRDDNFPDLFGNWLEMLDVMEDWLSLASNSSLGAAVGAPWGLALTATLRAYVVDALLSIFMLSLPLSRLHDQAAAPPKGAVYKYHYPFGPSKWRTDYKSYYNAMIAVGLWEASTGRPAPHCNKGNDGFLTPDPKDAVLNVMSAWTPDTMAAFWGSLGAPHADLSKYLADEAKRYFLWSSVGDNAQKNRTSAPRDGSDALSWKDAPRLGADELFDTWPAHPRFFLETRQRGRPSDAKDEDQTGTLWSQLSLFVMSTIAAELMRGVGADGKAFSEGAGSLMWGGCNYTHREHRFGSVFDIAHRFPHPPWKLQSVGEKKKSQMYLGVQLHEQRTTDIESVEYDRFYYPKDGIDKTVAEALAEFKVGTTVAAIEKQYLLGTSLQYTPRTKPSGASINKLQVNMIGHVALLLTAPYKMILAAPIMHLRSIQLIREGFTKDELAPVSKVESFLWPQEFYFKPDDHNDHWHVVYYALSDSPGDPKATKGPLPRGEGQTIGISAVTTLCTFWRDLGVPLDKFVAYLEGLALVDAGPIATVRRAATEAKTLQRVLKPLIAKAASNSDKQLTTRLAPLVRLLQLPRYVECAPGVSNRLKAIRIPVREPGVPAGEENEYDRWQSEQSTEPGVSY